MGIVDGVVGPLSQRPNRGERIGDRYLAINNQVDYVWNGAAWIGVGSINQLNNFATDLQSNGTLVPENAQDVGFPRWSLADAATQRVKWAVQIPPHWDAVGLSWVWDNEAAGAGNVVWQFAYRLLYFGEGDVDAGAMTTIAIGPIAAANQFDLSISGPSPVAAIPTPSGALFGEKPFMVCSLSRLGADGADSLVGAVAVLSTGLGRVE